MREEPEPSVLGSLPHSRPHRRSDKRAARPEVAAGDAVVAIGDSAEAVGHAAGAIGDSAGAVGPPESAAHDGGPGELLVTVAQAAAELATIGLGVGARALRIAASRLPRP